MIEDPEAVVLQVGDLPVDFVEVEQSGLHATNEESCATAPTEDERQECVDRLNRWGRRDHYQVAYLSTGSEALFSGIFSAFSGVSVYETVEGAAESFGYNRGILDQRIEETPEISSLLAPDVGDESLAFVVEGSEQVGERTVPISSYVIDFRRGNLIVRVRADVATALGNVDEALGLARRVDERILQVASQISPTVSPTASP